ncbi:MAG: CDP-2,3-bis-(O-geranylgeranyl)-sn-glycerol synthase [Candidatus Bathyarchaeia archaeon]
MTDTAVCILENVGRAIYLFFPAYVANAIPVILGGGTPVDLGRKFYDGRPIFGPHKTLRGLLSGILAGTLTGMIMHGSTLMGLLLSSGALIGDLVGSFFKRRIRREPGSPLFPLDQICFILGAIGLLSIFRVPPASSVVTIIVITPPIHILINRISRWLGIRETGSRSVDLE